MRNYGFTCIDVLAMVKKVTVEILHVRLCLTT